MTKEAKSETVYLELEDFKQIVNFLISIREEFTEDIPPFETRYPEKLESIVEQIKAEYFGEELYKGIINKAVWLFYCLIKNHPFLNGNKRIAVVALFDFLKRNVSELYINEEAIVNDLFQIAIKTSESKPEEVEKIKNYLKRKIKSFIIEM